MMYLLIVYESAYALVLCTSQDVHITSSPPSFFRVLISVDVPCSGLITV